MIHKQTPKPWQIVIYKNELLASAATFLNETKLKLSIFHKCGHGYFLPLPHLTPSGWKCRGSWRASIIRNTGSFSEAGIIGNSVKALSLHRLMEIMYNPSLTSLATCGKRSSGKGKCLRRDVTHHTHSTTTLEPHCKHTKGKVWVLTYFIAF